MEKVFIVLLILLFPLTGFTANHYIRQGATGSADGSDWTNAWTDLPSSFVRGDTYYIADGTYGNHAFTTAESGTDYITVKKATSSDHGTETGWSSSYGDGQSFFYADPILENGAVLEFRTGYWILNGQWGSGSDENNYGFKMAPVTYTGRRHMISCPPSNAATLQIDHIQISYVAMVFPGCDLSYVPYYDYNHIGIYSNMNTYTGGSFLLSNNLFKGGNTNLAMRGWTDGIIENNYFYWNWSTPTYHGQQISPGRSCDNIILRGNMFRNSKTFVVGAHHTNYTSNDDWQIYNNIILDGTFTSIFGSGDSGTIDVVWRWQVHHNTFINTNNHAVKPCNISSLDNKSFAYNNSFYNCSNPRLDNSGFTANAVTHNNNYYGHCVNTINSADETSPQRDDAAISPFTSITNEDFTIADPLYLGINTGKDLAATYDTDRAGMVRDSTPTIGAYEFLGAAEPDPTGTLTPYGFASETLVQTGGGTIVINITGTTLVEAGATFDAIRQDIIDGLSSNKTAEQEPSGGEAVVFPNLPVTSVVRTDDDTITITFPDFDGDPYPEFDLFASEIWGMILPGSAVLSGQPITLAGQALIISVDTGPAQTTGSGIRFHKDGKAYRFHADGVRITSEP